MRNFSKLIIISLTLVMFSSTLLLSMIPRGDPHSHGSWAQGFYEEGWYGPFDYIRIWMKTEPSGDTRDNYPLSQDQFVPGESITFWYTSPAWTLISNNRYMCEASGQSTSSDLFMDLNFSADMNSKKSITLYFETFQTINGCRILKNFTVCYFNPMTGWLCDNFDRPPGNPNHPPVSPYQLIGDIFSQLRTNLDNNMIGFWNFDECKDNVAFNSALPPNDYPGIIVGATRNQGFRGNGLNFDGHSFVDVGNVAAYDFNFNTPFSVGTWIKFVPWGDFGDIICKMTSPNTGYRGWGLGAGTYGNVCNTPNNVGGIRFDLNDSWSNQSIVLDIPGSNNMGNVNGWGDNKWHFVLATYSAAHYTAGHANASDLRVFIDGVHQEGCRSSGTAANSMSNDARMRIGYRNDLDPNRGFHGKIDEVYLFNKALSQMEQQALYTSYTCPEEASFCSAITQPSDLALWFDPLLAYTSATGARATADDSKVMIWPDQTPNNEDAVMNDPLRRPSYFTNIFGSKPGIKFTYDYVVNKYGYSQILESRYDAEVTSGETNIMAPDNTTSKTLMVEFKVGNSINGQGDPYPNYSDGRQTIFEAGGGVSGYNVYISHGYLCFGVWNRLERKFIQYTDASPSFYPLSPNQTYLALLEFDAVNQRFRAAVTIAGGVPRAASDWIPFSGFTRDGSDKTGIGGACRTRYYDYNIGETYSDHFGGYLGDIWLFNNIFENTELAPYYSLIGQQSGMIFPVPTFPENVTSPKNSDGWVLFEQETAEGNELSSAYPNPFFDKTSFALDLPEKQNLSVTLWNAQGNLIETLFSGELNKGVHRFTIDGESLSSGIYMFRVDGDNFCQTGKVILSK